MGVGQNQTSSSLFIQQCFIPRSRSGIPDWNLANYDHQPNKTANWL